MSRRAYGERVEAVTPDGSAFTSGVFDERQVRAAAGLTMVLAAMAFGFAFLAKEFGPIKVVTAFFLVEFTVRVTLGLGRSPVGWAARLLTRRGAPQWVSARPKRFAWTLGVVMSGAMTLITQANIRGPLPMTICLICLALMWLESVLGLCLGCEIYRVLVGRGWMAQDAEFEVCAGDACAFEPAEVTR